MDFLWLFQYWYLKSYKCSYYQSFYIQQNKKSKKIALNRLKVKTMFFYVYLRSSRTEFLNKLIASDFLMLWIIQRQSIYNLFTSKFTINLQVKNQ